MSKKLYVGNLSFNTTEAQLQDLFSAHGTVRSAQLINDRDTGRSKGFGFVEMGSDQEADSAAEALNGQVVDGRPLLGLTHQELGHVRPVRMKDDEWGGICTFHGDCVEGLASGPAIKARAGVTADLIPQHSPIWRQVAHPLAQLCHTLVMTGVPRRIVFGGGVSLGVPWLLPMIREMLEESTGGYGDRSLLGDLDDYIVPAALGGEAGPLGAILLGEHALAEERVTP